MDQDGELSHRPQSTREWNGAWRSVILPFLAIVSIIGAIWYLDSGRSIPLLQSENGGEDDTATYLSLESQGIKLGAAGGPAPAIDAPAPDFTLLDVDGNVVSLSDFRGQTVVLNFWATWCAPCRQEFPEFVSAYNRQKDQGLVILAVNVRENSDSVGKFARDFQAIFPILLDRNGSVAAQYRMQGLPVTWFVDESGVIRGQVIGLVTKSLLSSNLEQAGFNLSE